MKWLLFLCFWNFQILSHARADTPLAFQAFNMPFRDVQANLPKLRELGISIVQISPPQKSLNRQEWWARYQPVDYSKIEGPLGTESELATLVEMAKRNGIAILVDTVLNHMAGAEDFPGLNYPQFGSNHFHFPDTRPCIQDWNSRFQVTQFWFCGLLARGGLPDLDTSQIHVRNVHLQYLKKLLGMGVAGFRFDAAKHMERPYFEFLKSQQAFGRYSYGEVISSNPSEINEYLSLLPLTDYNLLGNLITVFSMRGDLRNLPKVMSLALPQDRSVVFARTHDSAMHPSFFNFENQDLMKMAWSYLLVTHLALPLLYRDDLQEPQTRAAMLFRRFTHGLPVQEPHGKNYCETCETQELHFVERGTSGWSVLNKSPNWFHMDGDVVVSRLNSGVWRELRYGFTIEIQKDSLGRKVISRWGEMRAKGMQIGPRTALFFVQM